MKPRQPQHVGDVIAERRLSVLGRPELKIIVRLGKPRDLDELFEDGRQNQDMFCPYQITGIGDEAVRYAAGVDGVQAIQLVMQAISVELARLATENHVRFQWLDGSDLGFHIS